MESPIEKVKILSTGAISATLVRMAYEMLERNFAEEALVLSGIGARGRYIADRLETHLKEISRMDVVRSDLLKVQGESGLAWADERLAPAVGGRPLILVDDVLYSGSTLLQALFLAVPLNPRTIQTAFLIDRGHHHYPITHDYVGMEIATSLKQYIRFEVDEETGRAEAFIY
ncbi:MAG: hypothetical protein RLZZ165_1850 [Bacteroidota bacterium]|jgi:pyrimidine operon attenuation protein/uracil phosphoribosyltransferase